MITRRRFSSLATAFAAGAPCFSRAAAVPAPAAETASFFLVGDTHYLAGREQPEAMDAASRAVTAGLVETLNRLPGSAFPEQLGGGVIPEPHGVIHAGDLVDSADKTDAAHKAMALTELREFTADWGLNGRDGRLKWPVREIHGNHDGPQGDTPVVEAIRTRNQTRSGLTGVSGNGLHYSWDWAGVHFVALGIVVGETPEAVRRRRYAPMESLPFLADDLKKHAADPRRPVVLVHHVDLLRYSEMPADPKALAAMEWDAADVQAYHETLQPYRVVATLHGHTHVRNLYRWDGTKKPVQDGGIVVLNTDNASHFGSPAQAFFHIEVSPAELRVREYATRDAWKTGEWTPMMWRFPVPA